jgi:hypothetical protein
MDSVVEGNDETHSQQTCASATTSLKSFFAIIATATWAVRQIYAYPSVSQGI